MNYLKAFLWFLSLPFLSGLVVGFIIGEWRKKKAEKKKDDKFKFHYTTLMRHGGGYGE